jgi:hypothetical protein
MKPIKFNPNDPKLWKDFDPTERAEEFVNNRSESDIQRIVSLRKSYEIMDPQILINRAEKIINNRNNNGWYEKVSKKNKEISQTETWKINHKEASEKLQNDPIHKERMKKIYESKKWKEHQKNEGERKRNDPNFKKIVRAIKCKPVIIKGNIFDSRKSAIEFYKVDSTTISNWLKNNPDECYYISKEEYIMLTGKDI